MRFHPASTRCLRLVACFAAALITSSAFAQSVAQLEQQAIRDAIEHVSPTVVQLQIIGGADRLNDVSLASGPSTGVILTPDGYVVTSRYRFEPAPATVVALLADGRQFATEVVAHDYSRKLVLLKLSGAEDLPAAEIAPADSYRVGQWAIAVGRTYRVERPNVSVGIVSALRRIQGRAMQTDAAVSAANYGGPLVDIEGRVLGIIAPMSPSAESSIAGVEWYDSGIGFAAPLAEWMPAFERLKQGEDLQLGYIGIGLVEGVARETPAKIATIAPDGPAAKAGLEKGDTVTAINGVPATTQVEMQAAAKPHYAGDTLEVTYQRGDETSTTTLTLTTIAQLQEAAEAAKAKEEAADEKAEAKEGDADGEEESNAGDSEE
ncbi:S1C family serine protease [Aeoliella sp. ICT_H6.2]|uniref:S1C family serine protease n=1 Tax=Aeoliella straminimaris TaxID=2954799 RepID=A0A9X2FGH5_9BACT|nr:trypsin-like peptidase domain-containing protein [Aeoliella straminimaris]MCO6047918.1 S1C family serine protease [Aeoliella straminimaris]